MTVKELIEILKELPEDMEVVHTDYETGDSEPNVYTLKKSDKWSPNIKPEEHDLCLIG